MERQSEMKWFKHYNGASAGNSLSLLWDAGDLEAYGFWWRLLELVSRWERPEARGKITLSWAVLRKELGWNRQRSSKVLSKIVQTLKVEVTPISEETFEVCIPNWMEFQETRGGKREAKNEQNPGEKRREKKERREKIEEPSASDSQEGGITLGSKIWNAYSDAHFELYGFEPIRNAKANTACKQIGERLGPDGIDVARFYLAHQDGRYLRSKHSLGPFLMDAEALHTQWRQGRPTTSSDVRAMERAATNAQTAMDLQRGAA